MDQAQISTISLDYGVAKDLMQSTPAKDDVILPE